MRQHSYAIVVNTMQTDNAPETALRIRLDTHDDLLEIIDRLASRPGFTRESAQAFGTGLKLFADTVRRNRDVPPFADIMPHLAAIMRIVKHGDRTGNWHGHGHEDGRTSTARGHEHDSAHAHSRQSHGLRAFCHGFLFALPA